MVKFDALKTAINVLRHWFYETLLGINQKIDDVGSMIVQADYDQSDPEQPDYIKNRPAYDQRNRTVVIPEQDISINAYVGSGYAAELSINAGFVEGILYEVCVGNVRYTTNCFLVFGEYLGLMGHPDIGIEYIYQCNSDTIYVLGPIGDYKEFSVNLVEDDDSKIKKLPSDAVTIPLASSTRAGGVKVSETPVNYSAKDIFMTRGGTIVAERELPSVGMYAAGRFLRVNSSGKWNAETVDVALKSDIPTVPTTISSFENDAGYLTEHQDISGKLDASALPEAVNDALAQAKESGEFDGDDGVSVTHSWDGTILTVTSASGSSSSDLKGDTGETGVGIINITIAEV